MKFKIILYIGIFLLVVSSALADIRPPSPGEPAAFWLVLLIFNYIVNFILIGIQSKIWLHLGFKKIAAGLAIVTPIMFVIGGLFMWLIQLRPSSPFYNNFIAIFGLAVINSGLIFVNYFFLAKHFWHLERKQTLTTAIIMAILTNPGLYYFFMFLYLEYLYVFFYTPPPNPYGPVSIPFSLPNVN